MNRFPLWKYLLLIAALTFGGIYALPNLYAPDPALQIISNSAEAKVDEQTLEVVTQTLKSNSIEFFGEEITADGAVFVRFNSLGDQLTAKTIVQNALEQTYSEDARFVVALNQASTTPEWLTGLGASPMNLGLDLAGGVHFLLQVDTPKALADRTEDMERALRKAIRAQRLFGVELERKDLVFTFKAETEEQQSKVTEIIRENAPQLEQRRSRSDDDKYLVEARISEATIREIEDHAVSQNLTTLRNRVNELGVSEPVVQKQGRNRIVVELPGVQDTAGAKKILGKTANLEFRLEANGDTPATQRERFEFRNEEEERMRGPVFLERQRIITGEHVVNATGGFDQQSNGPKIDITLSSEGGNMMHHATRAEVGRNMGVLFIDYYTVREKVREGGQIVERDVNKADKKIINLATIRSALGVQFQITGLDSMQEANDVALLLRAGSLAAPMMFVEERTIGPSLGQENIDQGLTAVKLGMALVVFFMLLYYKVFGFAANVALLMNVILLGGLMSMLGATLTLPGIAGIVLTIGMAVDANVLIFSRIKEELANGLPPQSAISNGFDRAFLTILDANVTTLIVAFILFAIGTGPIKGFAVTLSLGILTSMFTAIIGTRAVVNVIYGGRKISKLWI